jgi:hypothetical protein
VELLAASGIPAGAVIVMGASTVDQGLAERLGARYADVRGS